MISRLMLPILGIGMMLMFVQCDDISSPDVPKTNEETKDELSAPELISPVNGAENQTAPLELKWKQIRGAKEYHVQVSESEDFADVLVDSISAGTSLTTEPLTTETNYFWRVSPMKKNYTGPWSEVWQFTSTDEDQERISVELQSPESGTEFNTGEDLTFEWEIVEDAEGYHYQLSADSSFSEIAIDSVMASNSIELEELNGSKYFWRVSPTISSAPSGWSDTWNFTLSGDGDDSEGDNPGPNPGPDSDPDPTPAVTHISPSNGVEDRSTSLTLEWKGISGVEEYKVQVSDNSDFEDPIVDKTEEGTTYELEDLKDDQMYYWRILPAGGEKWSDFWSFHTKAEEVDETPTPPENNTDFVTAENGNFVVNGEVFRFAGTNAYYLPNYEKMDEGVVDRAMNVFEEAGVSVVRMWGFYDGYDCGYSSSNPEENVIQTSPGEYNEEALRDLDRVIAKGKERGIRFNLALLNYWDQLGGICQYNTWAGASNPSGNMDFFLNNSDTQKWFKEYISMLLNRVNTETGIAYKDEPAIFSWHIINEGRNTGADPEILRDWYQEMAQYIKAIDPNHMVSTGEEGFDNGTPSQYSTDQYSNTYPIRANEGTSYILNTAIPEIDYGSSHWYAPDFGFNEQSMYQAQHAWVKDHSEIAASEGKPFVLSEYGFPGWGDSRVDNMYDDFWSLAEEIELDGSMIWQLTADETKCYEFGGNICYPGGRNDTDLFNRFTSHIQAMSNSR
ncbi:MAG: hypothetical protein WEA56_11130 [Balneolaceae bacterium]